MSKVIPALQSRTTRFKFRQIPKEDAVGRLRQICQLEHLKVTEEALGDIVKISEGDMRKMVNTLQSIHMSLQSKKEALNLLVDRNYVFRLTGLPNPEDIQRIFRLLVESDDIQKAYEDINELRRNRGVSLASLLKDISEILVDLQAPGNFKGNVYKRMAEIEYRLSIGCSEEKQLASLVGIFVESRSIRT